MRKTDRRFNFTQRSIEALPIPKDRRVSYRDRQVPELGLLVQPTGHKSYFWFRKVRGYPTWKTIGPVEDVPLEQARGKAREHSVKATTWKLNEYKDESPFEKRPGEPTFGELVDAYIERHVKAHAKRPEHAEAGVRWTVNTHLASWKPRKLGTIRRKDVQKLHADLGEKHKHLANRVVQLTRALFNWAVDAELWNGDNPATKIKLYHEAKRTRFLQPDELPRLFTALRREPNPDLRDYVHLALWTGARKSDVLAMRWENVSLDDNRWEVPDPKNRAPYVVPLTPEAVKILKDRERARRKDNPWVFPSHGKSGHVVDLKGAWKKLLTRAKITGLRQHDLRRTQGSWQAAQGASLQLIGKALGHKSIAATQIYSQLQLDPVRAVMTAANQAMAEAMRRKPRQLGASRG